MELVEITGVLRWRRCPCDKRRRLECCIYKPRKVEESANARRWGRQEGSSLTGCRREQPS